MTLKIARSFERYQLRGPHGLVTVWAPVYVLTTPGGSYATGRIPTCASCGRELSQPLADQRARCASCAAVDHSRSIPLYLQR